MSILRRLDRLARLPTAEDWMVRLNHLVHNAHHYVFTDTPAATGHGLQELSEATAETLFPAKYPHEISLLHLGKGTAEEAVVVLGEGGHFIALWRIEDPTARRQLHLRADDSYTCAPNGR